MRSAPILFVALAFGAACTEYPATPRDAQPVVSGSDVASGAGTAAAPPGASVPVTVSVPAALATPPFDVPRTLNVPPGFSVEVVARVSGARFIELLPGGDVLVSQPRAGRITLVRPVSEAAPRLFTFASGLTRPHDMVLHTIGGTRYLYIAESNQVSRAIFVAKDTIVRARTVVVANLPDNNTPGLGGYSHPLKNIALDKNNKLYVSIASTCNVCLSDGTANPVRGAIYQYNADGSGGVLFARGLRNAEGLGVVPGTATLWVAVNNRDNIKYPFDDGSGKYGQIIPSYVDDHPPEEFTNVRRGGDYGWPFCNPNPDMPSGMDNMPFDPDYDFLAQGVNCATKDRIAKGIQAHSAPLGIKFLQNTGFPSAYRDGVVIARHGSWNRTQPTGYKVIYFPWVRSTQRPGAQIDLVTGWLQGGTAWGRPVDLTPGGPGSLLISDDLSGTIYRLKSTTGGS